MWYRSSRQFLSILWGTFWIVLSTGVIATALLVVLLRAGTATASWFQPQLTAWVEQQAGISVELKGLSLDLEGRFLNLHIEQLQLRDPQTGEVAGGVAKAVIQTDLIASLGRGEWVTTDLSLHQPQLYLRHAADGSLQVVGNQADTASSDSTALGWGEWLLTQPALKILGAEIRVEESRFARLEWLLSDVDLSLVNSGYRHQATGSAVLNGERSSPLQLQLEWFGDLHHSQGWDGQMHLSGDSVHLADLIGGGDHPWGSLAQGEAQLQLWGEWLSGRLEKARVSLQRDSQYRDAPGLAGGELHWRRQGEEAWRMQIEQLVWGGEEGHGSHPSSALVEHRHTPGGEAILLGAVDHVRLVASPELSGLYATVVRGEGGMLVSGDLEQVKFRSFPDQNGLFNRVEARMELRQIAISGIRQMAGYTLSGINGLLHLNQHQGYFLPAAGQFAVGTGALYSQPVGVDWQQGVVHWQQYSQAVVVTLDQLQATVQTVDLSGRAQLLMPTQGEPLLKMTLGVSAQRITDLVDGLPQSQLDPRLMNWLQASLLSGELAGGIVEIEGGVSSFPYADGGGRFRAALDLKDVYLQFDPAWPAITHSHARLGFDNESLQVNLQQGKIDGHPIHSVTASVSTVGAERVEIHGRIVSDSSKLMHTLEKTPLQHTALQLNRVMALEGYALLDIDVEVPLDEAPEQVSGRVELHDNQLAIEGVDLVLTRLNGNVDFTDRGVAIDGIEGEMLGGPVRLTAFTAVDQQQQQQVVVGVTGTAEAEQVESWLKLDEVQRTLFESQGKTPWDGRLTLQQQDIKLHLHSDLQGVALHTPPPLNKQFEERWPTTLTLRMHEGEVEQLNLSTPQRIKANLSRERMEAGLGQWYGKVQLGEPLPASGEEHGRSGVEINASFDQASLDAWYNLWKGKLEQGEESRVGGFNLGKMVIRANEASLFEQSLTNLGLVMELDEHGYWGVGVSSDQVEGKVRVPIRPDEVMVVDLNYLQLGQASEKLQSDGDDRVQAAESSRAAIDPAAFPPLQVKSRQTVINGIDFGALALEAHPVEDGLLIDRAQLDSETMTATAQGTWLQWGKEARSRFIIDVEGERIGEILGQFGYRGEIDRGKSTIRVHADWPDTPLDFSLEEMDGELSVAVEKGQLLELDQGVGRVFGLLGIHTLVRRLTLDFSDITDKGFAFDTIEGTFNVQKGDAYTRNLVIDGPSATIRVEGRTGIVAQDYDQSILVSPKISETLPATGALVGGPAGAAVGSVLLLYQKLFQKEGLASTRYQLSGSWDDPQLNEVKPTPPVTEPALIE